MTNVPGFIPKPYPIVIFPGTFVIILQKVAVDFLTWKQIPPCTLKIRLLNAIFRRIMTSVPGFIPKPYPIVIFPGTFFIIPQKMVVEFFVT